MILLVSISPFILLIYSIFSSFPVLKHISRFSQDLDDINMLLFNSFLYIYIILRFMYNISIHLIVNRRKVVKFTLKYITFYLYSFELCLSLNLSIQYFLLIRSGDIETNPGPHNKDSLSICHWNLNGISAQNYVKLSMLEAYNAIYDYDIICISETFLNFTQSGNDPALKLKGYELIRSDHPSNTKRGGVCLYYKEHLPLQFCNDTSNLKECIVVQLKSKKTQVFYFLPI